MDQRDSHCPYSLSSEITAKLTVLGILVCNSVTRNLEKKLQKYYHRGSNWGSSTRGTALTRYVFIGCCDSGNNPDSNACQNTWRKYIWTPLKIGPGLVMWWSMNNMRLWPFCLCAKNKQNFSFFFCCGNTVFTINLKKNFCFRTFLF